MVSVLQVSVLTDAPYIVGMLHTLLNPDSKSSSTGHCAHYYSVYSGLPTSRITCQGHQNRVQSIRSPYDSTRPSSRHLRIRAIAEKERTLEKQASKTTESLHKAGPVQRLISAQQQLQQGGASTKELLWRSLLVGLTFGTLFQVTHNNGFLPVGPSTH